MSPLLKNLIIALGITLVIAVGYYFTMGSDLAGDVVATDTGMSTDATQRIEEIKADILEVDRMQLERRVDLFSRKEFTSLKDYRVDLREIPTGRDNPFAPLF